MGEKRKTQSTPVTFHPDGDCWSVCPELLYDKIPVGSDPRTPPPVLDDLGRVVTNDWRSVDRVRRGIVPLVVAPFGEPTTYPED